MSSIPDQVFDEGSILFQTPLCDCIIEYEQKFNDFIFLSISYLLINPLLLKISVPV